VSVSPLSGGFREQLEDVAGASVEVLDLAQLRRLPVSRLIAALHDRRGQAAFLALEDPSSAGALPILHAIAALARPRSITVVHDNLSVGRRTSAQLATGLAALARASADGALAATAARHELRALADAPRRPLRADAFERVLYVNANMWFGLKAGGSVGHVAGVVNGLAELGLDVTLATATAPILVRPDVKVVPLPPPAAFALPFERNFARFQRRLVQQLADPAGGSYDVLYQRLSLGSYAGTVLSRRLGIPLVLEFNGSEVWAARNWGRPLRYEAHALQAEDVSLRHAHVIVTVSEILRDELVARGVDAERIVWYPNGVDPERYSSETSTDVRSRLGIAPEATVVGFIGTFGSWHGVEVLARAVAQLAATDESWFTKHGVHVLLVGDGLRMPEVQKALRGAAQRYVTITGLVPQSVGPRYLAAADILVSPHVPNADGSRFFGSPTKLFEYMAMGRAILASDLEQIGQVLQPALSTSRLPAAPPAENEPAIALLARPGSVDDIVTGLRFLVEQPEWRARIGANARARVLERYTWSHHVGAIVSRLRLLSTG
jgi:glycosyltransferase involved in cell wall biosynthesis